MSELDLDLTELREGDCVVVQQQTVLPSTAKTRGIPEVIYEWGRVRYSDLNVLVEVHHSKDGVGLLFSKRTGEHLNLNAMFARYKLVPRTPEVEAACERTHFVTFLQAQDWWAADSVTLKACAEILTLSTETSSR